MMTVSIGEHMTMTKKKPKKQPVASVLLAVEQHLENTEGRTVGRKKSDDGSSIDGEVKGLNPPRLNYVGTDNSQQVRGIERRIDG